MNTFQQVRIRVRRQPDARGFSLLELAVVLMILVATAAIVLPVIQTGIMTPAGEKSPSEIVTESTLRSVREAIVGDQGVVHNLAVQPDAMPRSVADLVRDEPPEHIRRTAPQLARFNPVFGVGWRGPYILPTGTNDEGKPTVVDGWGQEIELQVDFDADGIVSIEEFRCMRLVSAGPNGRVDTPADSLNMHPGEGNGAGLTADKCGDDIVVFISVVASSDSGFSP